MSHSLDELLQVAFNAYLKIGATPLNDWTMFRLDEAAMNKFANN